MDAVRTVSIKFATGCDTWHNRRMASKKSYTDEQRAEGLAVLASNGGNVNKTARETGIPRGTLMRWNAPDANVSQEIEDLRQEKKKNSAIYWKVPSRQWCVRSTIGRLAPHWTSCFCP